jgi:hypothetical protein
MSNAEHTTVDQPATLDPHIQEMDEQFSRARLLQRLRLLRHERQFLLRWVSDELVVATSLELSF